VKAPACAGAVLLAACTSVVSAPRATDDDVEVLLVQEGWHSGLVLAAGDPAPVEWGYGDFRWYALGHDRWFDVLPALFWPTAGTLSRRTWPAGERERRAAGTVVAFAAPRARVERLARDLEAAFERERASSTWNAEWQTDFVVHRDAFWLFHDCHDATARWLAELGCAVEPALVRAGLSLRTDPERLSSARARR
jgi:hypothetical protein